MLKYQPKEGEIMMCDYRGSILPEMIKKRPVVVLRNHITNSRLVMIVPISTTAPIQVTEYHYFFETNSVAGYFSCDACWAKCDMASTVSIDRLSRCSRKITKKTLTIVSAEVLYILNKKVASSLGFSYNSEGPVETGP